MERSAETRAVKHPVGDTYASLAQQVEHRAFNPRVLGSIPRRRTRLRLKAAPGQARPVRKAAPGQAHKSGEVAESGKAADCKSADNVIGGSNPSLSTSSLKLRSAGTRFLR